ncbi:MAG: SDR family oxidoreductase [Anaerolineales bacterium]|nr:SDR family oxidoreductase [Anaerolineales bacterium]MCB0009664.1 SDR family oxidoreductase [Anaerolineales bacterium]MCB0012411.1 SDR family oxidoreductase [Anaerolineales bacterium]
MTNQLTLSGKVALVTGASRGIGRAIARGYAAAGAAVGCAARDEAGLASLVAEIEAAGGRAVALPTDVTDEKAVNRMVTGAVDAFGGLDILVANAGVNLSRADVADSDTATWEETIAVNLFGVYYCIKAAIPHLKARGAGKIITVGSGLGHNGIPGLSAYACSKAALWMLTQVVAQELAGEAISVNELIPGPVNTTIGSDDIGDAAGDSFSQNVLAKNKEWVKLPADVVPLALFLATQPDIGPTAQSFNLMRRAR